MASLRSWLVVLLSVAQLLETARAQATRRVSVDSSGGEAMGSSYFPSVSADGRYVAFDSDAATLVPGDTNQARDVFVRDLLSGTTERVSVNSAGVQGNAESREASISADGRFVAFWSYSNNLGPVPTWIRAVFVHDRTNHTTEIASISSAGILGNGTSIYPAISSDGRFVAFGSGANNLVPGGTTGTQVFVRDRLNATTELVSLATNGAQGDRDSVNPAISADGRFVAFESSATNLGAGPPWGGYYIFVRDRQTGITEVATLTSGGALPNNGCGEPSLSADGRFLAFSSPATNFSWPTNPYVHVFVRDRQLGTTERLSVSTDWTIGIGNSEHPSISMDGRFVTFSSDADNLVPGDTNARRDVFCRDRLFARTDRMSVDSLAVQGNGDCLGDSISGDLRVVAFSSRASNLVAGDTNGSEDIFVRERAATGVISLCDPGVDGVQLCPCSNPPAGSGRGCDNSGSTGGARLVASGFASVSVDELSFATSDERATALSIVLQGNATVSTGIVFGQGMRCAGGTLKRLYSRSAVAGGILAPDPVLADPTVTERSAALGDPIQPSHVRWYFVYYRDSVVLGGCPASSTFNATQTMQVGWSL